MPGIFTPDDIPAWMNPTRNIIELGRESLPIIARNFSEAFNMQAAQKTDAAKLRVEGLKINLMEQQQELSNVSNDQKAAYKWMQEKSTNPDAPEPAWQSKQYQQNSWANDQKTKALENKRLEIENLLEKQRLIEQSRADALAFKGKQLEQLKYFQGERLRQWDEMISANESNRSASIVQATREAERLTSLAASETDPDIKQAYLDDAKRNRDWAEKQGQFAPQKTPASKTEKIEYNKAGQPVTRTTTFEKLPSDSASTKKIPAKGDVMQGYRFKGGDPSKPENWEKVNE